MSKSVEKRPWIRSDPRHRLRKSGGNESDIIRVHQSFCYLSVVLAFIIENWIKFAELQPRIEYAEPSKHLSVPSQQ